MIYMIKCPCDLTCIGKTSRPLKICISEHKSAIHHSDIDTPVAKHFLQNTHDLSSFRFLGIESAFVPKMVALYLQILD